MILFFDADGRLTGSLAEGYPAPAGVLERVRGNGAQLVDVPPFEPRFWYLANGALTIRPRLDLTSTTSVEADGREVLTITGVPTGGTVAINGPVEGQVTSDGEAVEIVFPQPGQYRAIVSADPYQPAEFNVTVKDMANGAA